MVHRKVGRWRHQSSRRHRFKLVTAAMLVLEPIFGSAGFSPDESAEGWSARFQTNGGEAAVAPSREAAREEEDPIARGLNTSEKQVGLIFVKEDQYGQCVSD